jgi:hypothetical protein
MITGKEREMANAKALLIVGLTSMAVLTSLAYGGAPMGPPMALLGEGNWGFGGEYGHETMDLQASGTITAVYGVGTPTGPVPFEFVENMEISDLAMNMFFGTIAYGVCDNWDIYVRIGVSDAGDDVSATSNSPLVGPAGPVDGDDLIDQLGIPQTYPLGTLDSSFGFAWGVGTRATFCRSGPWSFGGLVQATWFKPGDSDISYTDPLWGAGVEHVGDASLDLWEAQVSLAVAYQMDTWRLWAGPYLQFVAGDFDRDGSILFGGVDSGDEFCGSSELQQESEIGAHFGADVGVSEQVDVWLEGQMTGDSWFFGVGLIFKPQQTFGM